MDKKILALALEALELRKASIEAEIASVRSEMTGRLKAAAAAPPAKAAPSKKRGPKSRAAKKAQSERMKAYWAKKRAESEKKQGK
jgi:hypothetical protein